MNVLLPCFCLCVVLVVMMGTLLDVSACAYHDNRCVPLLSTEFIILSIFHMFDLDEMYAF